MTQPGIPEGPRDRRRYDRADLLSTSLLLDLTTIAVDPAYVDAAAARAARGDTAPRPRGTMAAMLLSVIGLLVAVAFGHTRRSAPEAARLRSTLIERVEQLTARADSDASELESAREELARDREQALMTSAAGRTLADQMRGLEFASAAAAVSGRGVTVRISDADAESSAADGRVQDRDLQRAVNIAWSAGAEAVAINGQRVGPLTAIRQAGDSILVDYRPVSTPYDISMIGDPGALESAFTVSTASSELRAVARAVDIDLRVTRSKRVDMPGAGGERATIARPVSPSQSQERSPSR